MGMTEHFTAGLTRHDEPPSDAAWVVVHLVGLTPAALGPTLFQRVFHCVRMSAEYYAPNVCGMEATYDPVTHERTGYEITVPDKLTALRVRLCHDLARQCRPMPWVST
jgi:hypothetical protein